MFQNIRDIILANRFYVVQTTSIKFSQESARTFYQEHKNKFFYHRLVSFMTREVEHHSLETISHSATPSTPGEGRKPTRVPRDNSSSIVRKRKQRGNDDETTEVLQSAGRKLKALQSEDSFGVYGKHIANKLRGLKGKQNIFAQKLINDVQFVEMETLTKGFKVLNCGNKREPPLMMSQGFPYCPPPGPTGSTFFQQPAIVNPSATRAETPCPGTSSSANLTHL
uniref:Nucleoside diphosphate kinase-like domain-containing protein n=1 Tax=Timema bartmani TaxID=61472 RepID=A0A7R9I174_9NEOP|nr:unnamed protein product [Timema bartmani]